MRIIEMHKGWRIIEEVDTYFDIDDLKGDAFNLKHKDPSKSDEEIKAEEKAFEREVYEFGVFGFSLEKWNPAVGVGWERVDSYWEFVGPYSTDENDTYNHYIVDELRNQIPADCLEKFLGV